MSNHTTPDSTADAMADDTGRAVRPRAKPDVPEGLTRPQLTELAERRLDEIRVIEAQLGNRDQLVNGRRRTDTEWHAWRVKAKTAWRVKMAEYREIRRQLGGGISPYRRRIPLLDAVHGGLKSLTRVYRAAVAHIEGAPDICAHCGAPIEDETFEALEDAVLDAEAVGEQAMQRTDERADGGS
jgi:hypothetical protein